MRVIIDGDAAFVAADDFVNLQESDASWIDVPPETLRDFQRRDENHRLREATRRVTGLLNEAERICLEHRAGYTDEEFEKHGDAVLMTWRDWVRLREKLKEMYEAAPLGKEPLAWWGARRATLDEVMREMDETQP